MDIIKLLLNPINRKLYLKFPLKKRGFNRMRVINTLGSVVYSRNITVTETSNIVEINPRFLAISGFYIFSFSNEIGEHQTIKFFKD